MHARSNGVRVIKPKMAKGEKAFWPFGDDPTGAWARAKQAAIEKQAQIVAAGA